MRRSSMSVLLPVAAAAVAAVPVLDSAQQGSQAAVSRVVQEVEQLDAMRSGLARGFGEQGVPATRETFAQVCRPVGMRAQQLARDNGWKVQQLAEKNRNPANGLDGEAARVFRLMLENQDVMGMWTRASVDGRQGHRYFRRITVESACLACHGAEDSRPDFVRQGYPDDRAFGFAVGDLRGVYSVFVPDTP